jgi:hypothetical protein
MELKAEYITRFLANKEMKEILPKVEQRVAAAKVAFNVRWDNAPVTVTKADGNKFFID